MSVLPKAFLPEESGAAQAVTEGAAREQICIRAALIRHCQITPSVLPQRRQSSSLMREPALSVAPRHLSQRERQAGLCARQKNLPQGVLREIVLSVNIAYLKYLTPFSKIG